MYVVLYGVTTATTTGEPGEEVTTYSTAYYLTLDGVEINEETDTVTIYVGFEYTYEYGYTYATGEVDGETGEALTATATGTNSILFILYSYDETEDEYTCLINHDCASHVGDETWKGWELDENGYAKIYSAYAVYVRYDAEKGEYVTEYVYEDGCRVIYCYYRCAYCGTFHQIGSCVEKTSLTPKDADGNALWTDSVWQDAGMSDDGSFTFDIDRVETKRPDAPSTTSK